MTEEFRRELASLLNRYSAENESDTPDFVLAQYLVASLKAFDDATNARGQFFGNKKPAWLEPAVDG